MFTFYRDFSPMGFYDIFNECQSYAMSLYGILMGYTIELPEYQFLVFRSNTPSIIRNADNYISISFPTYRNVYQHTIVGILNSILYKISHHIEHIHSVGFGCSIAVRQVIDVNLMFFANMETKSEF